jgi:hypothetical protein
MLSTSSGSIDADTSAASTDGTTLGAGPGTSTGDAADASSSGTSTGEVPGSSSGDATSSTSDPPAPTCNELFGAANGYNLCEEDMASCTFVVNANGASCNMICNSFDQACIGAIDNPGGLRCTYLGPLDCDDAENGSTICICAK